MRLKDNTNSNSNGISNSSGINNSNSNGKNNNNMSNNHVDDHRRCVIVVGSTGTGKSSTIGKTTGVSVRNKKTEVALSSFLEPQGSILSNFYGRKLRV